MLGIIHGMCDCDVVHVTDMGIFANIMTRNKDKVQHNNLHSADMNKKTKSTKKRDSNEESNDANKTKIE